MPRCLLFPHRLTPYHATKLASAIVTNAMSTSSDASTSPIESRLAVCSWSVRPTSPGNLCDALDSIGIRRVQLALSPILREPAIWTETFGILRDRGIETVSGMMQPIGEDYSTLESITRTGGLRPDEHWSENRNHAAAIANLAAEHDIRLITLHAGFMPKSHDDPERWRMIERLRHVADVFDHHGVTLGLETGQETAATLLDVLDEIARPNVAVNFDPANMILYGKGDPIDALRTLSQRVRQVHIKDALPSKAPGEWGEEVSVGEGAVDWRAFLEIAMRIDPPIDFVIEREAGKDRIGDIRQARNDLASVASDITSSHIP
jgi:L-ribulose-5-phosphate 3-epimerase